MEMNGNELNKWMGVVIPEIAKQKYVLKNYPQLCQSLVLLHQFSTTEHLVQAQM